MKDIGEEVAVMGDLTLPQDVERIPAEVPHDVKALALHTDVFDGFLSYLAAILDEDGLLAAAEYDLFRPELRHSCLSRPQLRKPVAGVR